MSDSDIIPATPPWASTEGISKVATRVPQLASDHVNDTRPRIPRVSSEPPRALHCSAGVSGCTSSSSQSKVPVDDSNTGRRNPLRHNDSSDYAAWISASSAKRRRLSARALSEKPRSFEARYGTSSTLLNPTHSEQTLSQSAIDRLPLEASRAEPSTGWASSATRDESVALDSQPLATNSASPQQDDHSPVVVERQRSPVLRTMSSAAADETTRDENGALPDDVDPLPAARSSLDPQVDSEVVIPPDDQPLPPRRNLRTRKPGQMNPYTLEMALYRQRLERNDWQDAVVFDRRFRRQVREEVERRLAAEGHHGGDGSTPVSSQELEPRRRSRIPSSAWPPSSRPAAASANYIVNPTATSQRHYSIQPRDSEMESSLATGATPPQPLRRRTAIPRSRPRLPSLSNSDTSSEGGPQLARVRRQRILSSSTSDTENSLPDEGADRPDRAPSEASSQSGGEYDSLFKKLKKMMPVHMARKHIADLKNMNKGKAYHSDGHVSETPEPSTASSSEAEGREDDARATAHSVRSTPATSPVTSQLRPGEARKRMRKGTSTDRGRLILSGDSESQTEMAWSRSASSDSDLQPIDGYAASTDDEAVEERRFNGDISWLTVGGMRTDASRLHQDHVDRSLRRSKPSTYKLRRPGKRQLPFRWQAHCGPSRSRPSDQAPDISPPDQRARRQRPKQRTSASGPARHARRLPAQPYFGENPPVVEVRTRRKLDLRDDDTIFALGHDSDDARDPHDNPAQADDVTTGLGRVNSMRRSVSLGHKQVVQDRRGGTPAPNVGPSDRQGQRAIQQRNDTPDSAHHDRPQLSRQEAGSAARTQVPRTDLNANQRNSAERRPPIGVSSSAQLEANAWADISHIRIDFDISPIAVGTAFAAHTYIGAGRLHELMHLDNDRPHFGGSSAHLRHYLQPLGFTLPSAVSLEEVGDLLPRLLDAVFSAVEAVSESSQSQKIQQGIDDALRFLHCQLNTWLQNDGDLHCRHAIGVMDAQIARLIQRLEVGSATGGTSGSVRNNAILQLRWFTIELSWRMLAYGWNDTRDEDLGETAADEETFLIACGDLMRILLARGIHRSIRCVQAAAALRDEPAHVEQAGVSHPAGLQIDDLSTELWVRLIHLLHSAGKKTGHITAFWSLLESSLEAWLARSLPRSPVLLAEAIWYIAFALCALAQFSAANGTAGSSTHLTDGWRVVMKAFNSATLRYEEPIESRMPNSALRRRDRYIHAILLRCHRLHSEWGWSLSDCDTVIFKIFDIFSSHRLADLPTDGDHDFPVFLRQFDADLLVHEPSKEPTAYLTFINLLARVARSMQEETGSANEGDRKVSRLLSRLCPVRVMPFTKENRPTAHERSSLFNHYTLVLLYLYLVPSAAPQRLRQMKGFLVFQTADAQSQIACLRAMVYTLAVLEHHGCDVESVASWISSTAGSLLSAAEAATLTEAGAAPGAHFATVRRTKESVSLLVHCLRSIQHMIEHPSLRSGEDLAHSPYPDSRLLKGACGSNLLESSVAVEHAEVGVEALRCIKIFIVRRNLVVNQVNGLAPPAFAAQPASAPAGPQPNDPESQDSLTGGFEDEGFDYDDPDLERLLAAQEDSTDQQIGVSSGRPQMSAAQLRAKDYEFAESVVTSLSASLFRLLSNAYHPSRWSGINKQSTRQSSHAFVELVTDCWAGCANVLVRNGLRDWHSYLTYGNECWKRLGDFAGRRDIGLRFLQNVLMLDPMAYHENQSEFLQVWFQSAAARDLSIQATFTETLFRRVDPRMRWFEKSVQRWPMDGVDLDYFIQERAELVVSAVEGMRQDFESTGVSGAARRSAVFPCLSGFLSSMRTQLDELLKDSAAQDRPENAAYLSFCKEVLARLPEAAGPTLMRGIYREVKRGEDLLASLLRQEEETV